MMSFSLLNGLTRMFACGVEQRLHSQIESIIVVTAEMYFAGRAPAEVLLFLILA